MDERGLRDSPPIPPKKNFGEDFFQYLMKDRFNLFDMIIIFGLVWMVIH